MKKVKLIDVKVSGVYDSFYAAGKIQIDGETVSLDLEYNGRDVIVKLDGKDEADQGLLTLIDETLTEALAKGMKEDPEHGDSWSATIRNGQVYDFLVETESEVREVLAVEHRNDVHDPKLRDSGNLTAKVKKKNLEEVLALLSDPLIGKYYELPNPRHLEIFEAGLEMGRIAKQKMVTRVKLPKYVLYFIGTEAEALLAIADLPDVSEV